MAALFQKLSRAATRAMIVFLLLYGVFFMPLGQFTLAGHVLRILTTPEAHEFVDSVFGATRHLGRNLMGRVKRSLGPDDDGDEGN